MIEKSVILLLAFMVMWWPSVQAYAQSANPEANRLFVEANTIFISSKTLSASDREKALIRVRSLLDHIISEHPASKPAQAIKEGNAGAIVLSDLPNSSDVPRSPFAEDYLAAATSKLDEIEEASALDKLEHSVEILDILLLAKDLEEAQVLADQLFSLPKWEKVLAPQTVKGLREAASNADVSSKAELVCLVGTYVLDATIDQHVEPFIRAKLSSGFESYLVSFLHETVDGACAAGPALLAGSAGAGGLLYPIAKGLEVLNEVDSLDKANADFIDQAIDFAKLQIAALETVPTYDFQDLLDYKTAQDAVATDLMTGSGLNVGAGRRLLIANAVMLIKARQIEGKDVNAELKLLGQQVAEFDGTPENLWYRWAKTVNLGRDGLRDYAGFAARVFEDLGAVREPDASLGSVDEVKPSSVQIAGQTCTPKKLPVSRDTLLAWASKSINGITASGANWSLNLWDLTTNEVGPAVFTNSKGERTTGLWRPSEGQLCQSYSKGASWACHTVFQCGKSNDNNFILENSDGEISSLITTSVNGGAKEREGAVEEEAVEVAATKRPTDWRSEDDVRTALNWIENNYKVFDWKGCRQSYGPLSVELRQRLLSGTQIAVRRGNRVSTRAASNKLLAGDRFCIGNNAECAVSDMQLFYCGSGESIFWSAGGAFSGSLYQITHVERIKVDLPKRIDHLLVGGGSQTVRVEGSSCTLPALVAGAASAEWTGKCVGGKAVAAGTVTWKQGDNVLWRTRIGPDWGVVFDDTGGVKFDVDLSQFEISMKECDVPNSGLMRSVAIVPPSNIGDEFFENEHIVSELMKVGVKYGKQACPDRDGTFAGIRLEITRDSSGRNYAIAYGHNADSSRVSVNMSGNEPVNRLRSSIQSENENRIAQERQIAAQKAAEEKARQIAELEARLQEDWDEHMGQIFSGRKIINNVGDLLQYNKPKAIALLSQGVTLQLRTGNLAFQDGIVVLSDAHDPTDVFKSVRDLQLANMQELERWLQQTQMVGRDFSGPAINVVCRLNASALEKLDGKATVRFEATLQSLNGRSAVFDCKLQR